MPARTSKGPSDPTPAVPGPAAAQPTLLALDTALTQQQQTLQQQQVELESARAALARLIVSLANQQTDRDDAVTLRTETVGDLNAFLSKNIPYGNVIATNLSQGLIEVENMSNFDAAGLTNTQLPFWYFGSKAYRIAKAVRIHYTYAYPLPGQPPATGSLLFGYQPDDLISSSGGMAPMAARSSNNGSSPQGLLSSFQAEPQSATPDQLIELVNGFLSGTRPKASQTQFTGEIKNFDAFVTGEIPGQTQGPEAFVDKQPQATSSSPTIQFGPQVAYCGIARDNDPNMPFPYNLTELAAANRLDELIPWHFGGKAYRVTKAIRMTYASPSFDAARAGNGTSGTLLIGYQGPHPY